MVNKLLDKGTTKDVLPAHYDEVKLCNDFKEYFHEKIDKIRKAIEVEIQNSSSNESNTQIDVIIINKLNKFILLTSCNLKSVLKNMSIKFCDLDLVPTWLFMLCEDEIIPFLLYIINRALENGNFLKALKVALVKPSLKKANIGYDLSLIFHSFLKPSRNAS